MKRLLDKLKPRVILFLDRLLAVTAQGPVFGLLSGYMETFGLLTEGSKGFGWFTGLGHTDGVDCEDAHFIWHSFNHLLGFEWCFFDQVKVQSHPSGALFLFSLNEVAFRGWSESLSFNHQHIHLKGNYYVRFQVCACIWGFHLECCWCLHALMLKKHYFLNTICAETRVFTVIAVGEWLQQRKALLSIVKNHQ